MYQVQSATTFARGPFLARWLAANATAAAICSAGSYFVGLPLIDRINRRMGWESDFEPLGGILIVLAVVVVLTGMLFGYAQRKVLEQELERVGPWMAATVVAIPLSLVASVMGQGGLLSGLAPGVVLGVLQMWVLQRHCSNAGWWVLWSAVALTGAGLLAGLLVVMLQFVLAAIVGWTFYIVVTGVAMSWLLARR